MELNTSKLLTLVTSFSVHRREDNETQEQTHLLLRRVGSVDQYMLVK